MASRVTEYHLRKNVLVFLLPIGFLFLFLFLLATASGNIPDSDNVVPPPSSRDVDPEGEAHRVARRSASSSSGRDRGGRTSTGDRTCAGSRCDAAAGNISSRDAKKRNWVSELKKDILKKLRLMAAPNVTGRGAGDLTSGAVSRFLSYNGHGIPQQPVDGSVQRLDDEYFTPKTIIVLSQPAPLPALNSSRTCHFKVPQDIYPQSEVLTAQLWVAMRQAPNTRSSSDRRTALLQLRKIIKRNRQYIEANYRRRRIQAPSLDQLNHSWYFFDVKNLVQSWISHPEQNYGVSIVASDPSLQDLIVVQPRNVSDEAVRPFIEVDFKPASAATGTRSPRSTGIDCTEEMQETRCCRYPLSIDFEEFRWDWIIAPKRYDAYYCSGQCDALFYQASQRTHPFIQAANQTMGSPCCAPTQMSPLSVIYIDDKLKGVVYTSIPGMVVDKCGCL